MGHLQKSKVLISHVFVKHMYTYLETTQSMTLVSRTSQGPKIVSEFCSFQNRAYTVGVYRDGAGQGRH